MNDIMNFGELRATGIKYSLAILREDYKEALKFNQLIYESVYTRYQELLDKRKKGLDDEEKLMLNDFINLVVSTLEVMATNGETIKERIKFTKNKK